jgi:hypothetical protein
MGRSFLEKWLRKAKNEKEYNRRTNIIIWIDISLLLLISVPIAWFLLKFLESIIISPWPIILTLLSMIPICGIMAFIDMKILETCGDNPYH